MIEIVQYTKIGKTTYFFSKSRSNGMSSDYVKALVDMGKTNLSFEQFNEIVGA